MSQPNAFQVLEFLEVLRDEAEAEEQLGGDDLCYIDSKFDKCSHTQSYIV